MEAAAIVEKRRRSPGGPGRGSPFAALTLDAVAALRSVANRFGGAEAARKRSLLDAAAHAALTDVDALLAYHDVLLFLLAYPESVAMRVRAQRELDRVAQAACAIDANGPARARGKLSGTGIAGSTITIAFSHAIARWLVARYPHCADVDSFGARGPLLAEWLRRALPPAEFALIDAHEDAPDALLEAAAAGFRGSRLAWLLNALQRVACDDAVREALFDALDAFIALRPAASTLSRTYARGRAAPVFYHRAPLMRGVDADRLLATPLPPSPRLSRGDRVRLTDAGRAVLAMLGRETDPITHADPRRTRLVDAGRGVTLALYSARTERRNPLDSHIGYVLFKNGVPVGYGGGWPFLGRCKIGINIFAPFRGGESALLMASVLRVYAHCFAVERFIVEPYQFGAGNREGLASGAFWFYYRLGFRPVDARLRDLAYAEFARMAREPGYRPPLPVLRRFTRSDVERVVVAGARPACDPADLSEAVTAWIAARFGGRREAAVAYAERRVSAALGPSRVGRWSDAERAALRAMAPVLAQVPDLHAWPARDKARLATLIRAKAGDEYRYFATMARLPRLRDALDAIAGRYARHDSSRARPTAVT